MAQNSTAEKKKVIWKFVNPGGIFVDEKSTKADSEKKFSFFLTRYKDSDTHEESLRIDCFKDGEENGFIITTPCSLDSDLADLKRYGVMFSPIVFRDLRKEIEENYLDIQEEAVNLSDNDKRQATLIELVKEFVKDDSDLVTKDFCYVPVNQFNGFAEDCGYYSYEMRTLRVSLAKGGYIRKQGDRYAVSHRINNKMERAVAFYQSKLNVPVPPDKKSNRNKTSDADEK